MARFRTARRTHVLRAAALAAAAVVLTGCGGSTSAGPTTTAASSSTDGTFPVTVTNCGSKLTFTKPPTRAVSNDINTTESMLALGLESHMVGDFGVNSDGPNGKAVPQQYQAAFQQVPTISPSYFTLEPLVGLRPDFLFAGWNYGLHTGTDLTPDGLAKYGIKTLALTESCAHVQSGTSSVSIDDTYQDLTNLGQIFGVRTKAQQLIDSMKAEVSAAQAKTAGQAPLRVFVYDSGQPAPFTADGLAMPDALIQLGGGTNVFADLKQSWTSVSWEQVAAADPQCVIINDYGTPSADQKQQFLETSPITKNLTAVKNHCFLTLSYDQLTPGPRNAEAVTAIARWLHPAAFGLPTTGA
jgi:iron complex transport system substrate-binding protein